MSTPSLTPETSSDREQALVLRKKVALATALFKDDGLSLTRAAKVAGTSLPEFMQHLSRSHIPVIQSSVDDVKKDVETLEAWLALPSAQRVRPRSNRRGNAQ